MGIEEEFKKVDEKNKGLNLTLSPERKKEIEKFRAEHVKNLQIAWKDLIESLGITDDDIKEIIRY